MEVRTLDAGLCKKFDQISCDDGKELRLSFKTIHTHSSLLNTTKNIIRVHESATSLDKIYNVFVNPNDTSALLTWDPYTLYGAIGSDGSREVHSYNAKVGSAWVYNNQVEEPDASFGNSVTYGHVKNALGYQDHSLVMERSHPTTFMPSKRHFPNVWFRVLWR